MLTALRQGKPISKLVLLGRALFEQFAEWLVFMGRSVCGNDPRPLAVLVASPFSRSRGGRRTRFSIEVLTRPARRLPSTSCPPFAIPFSE